MKKIFPFLLLIFLFSQTKASHIIGGDITYTWVGPGVNTYSVKLNLYRDCDGITMQNPETITAKSVCGANFQFSVNLIALNGMEVSQLCPSMMGMSLCNAGIFPGTQFYQYEGIVNLTPACIDWTFSWTQCCRNNTANVPSSSSDDMYIETKLNLAGGIQNNSPYFSVQPGIYVSANQAYNFDIGVLETDGDSLKHEFVAAKINSNAAVTYSSGYSALQPIQGITIDQFTGMLNFTPTVQGKFIIAIKTTEYNQLGQIRGSVVRDFEIIVTSSLNHHPDINSGIISNLGSNALINANNEIEICGNNALSFDATYNDLDTANILTMTSNLASIVGANNFTITVSGINPIQVSFLIQIPGGMSDFAFITTVNDNNCPDFAVQNYQYNVKVRPSISNLQNQVVCGAESTQLNVSGGNVFTWYDLSGNLIPVDTNFSCNPCANPIISPNVTSTYIVQSDLVNGCANMDTITIFHSNDVFTISFQNDSATCLNNQFNLSAVESTAGNYTYQWSPDSLIDNSTVANPLFLATYPGNFWIYNATTNSSGCTTIDSMQITVSNNPQFNAVAFSDTVCVGTANQLEVNVSPIASSLICGAGNNFCQNGYVFTEIGQDSLINTSSSYPAVFGNFYWGAKHQMLYRATELNAMGASAGTISSISFYIENLNSSTTIYNNVNIRLKCSQVDSLNSWETGLMSVLTIPSYTVQVGWNTFNFSNTYNWDGNANLIVQFCFNNSSYADNCSNTYTITPFNSVLYFRADQSSVCSSANAATVSNQRPNIKFGFCSTILPSSSYSYTWTPSNSLINPTVYNPQTTVPNAGTYQVVVTDLLGGCSDTTTVLAQDNGIISGLAPVIAFNNITLSTGLAFAYQWFYNGVAIPGADSSSLIPLFDGDYFVQVFDSNFCSAVSTPFTVLLSSIKTTEISTYQLFPNPAKGLLNLNFVDAPTSESEIGIYNNLGQMVFSKKLTAKNNCIPIQDLATGLYYYFIRQNSTNHQGKIVIE